MTAVLIAVRLWWASLFPDRSAEDERLDQPLIHIGRSPLLAPRPIWDGPTRRLPIVANYRTAGTPTGTDIGLVRTETTLDELILMAVA